METTLVRVVISFLVFAYSAEAFIRVSTGFRSLSTRKIYPQNRANAVSESSPCGSGDGLGETQLWKCQKSHGPRPVVVNQRAGSQSSNIQTDFCQKANVWFSPYEDPVPPTTSDWSSQSVANRSRFDAFSCLQVPGFHAVQTHLKTVVLLDRTDTNNSFLYFPGTSQLAFALEMNVTSQDQRPLDVHTNTFCSTGQFLPNGTFISIGGHYDYQPSFQPTGFFSVRAFTPCTDGTCGFSIVGQLTTRRWYPTSQLLGDGRILIVGGCNDSTYINTPSIDNPTVEYWPRRAGEGNYQLPFLSRNMPYNLYPIVHLLPSGAVFIFAGQCYTLFNTTTNHEIPGNYPCLNVTDSSGSPIYRSYPVAGSSSLFPLTSQDNYQAEVMICGGSTSKSGNPDRSHADSQAPADDSCWRIRPELENLVWFQEYMCKDWHCKRRAPRVMPDLVLLADGSLLIINGAERGYGGIPNSANEPSLAPLLYFTHNHTWYHWPLASSKIARVYHSLALLLHDATVFVGGSNPNYGAIFNETFPTELRSEIFVPPYLTTGLARPVLVEAPPVIRINHDFNLTFSCSQHSRRPFFQRFAASLVHSGFSTHNQRHGMRNVRLDFVAFYAWGNTVIARLHAPPSLNIAPPAFYWLHVLDNGVPNVEGKAVQLTP